ncbi:hypothetical protein SKAU_G00066380 [Synaphobranchus kaupii]|uniref:Uncharacterized protein n=1 Tax=Synaphobranchus kaupii TaxID=118154 RepID=A0A9Q1G5X2_SYNKA|nr:hypothetical protein SKAU_G00066380 [Synaphobranchus kaupii]
MAQSRGRPSGRRTARGGGKAFGWQGIPHNFMQNSLLWFHLLSDSIGCVDDKIFRRCIDEQGHGAVRLHASLRTAAIGASGEADELFLSIALCLSVLPLAVKSRLSKPSDDMWVKMAAREL